MPHCAHSAVQPAYDTRCHRRVRFVRTARALLNMPLAGEQPTEERAATALPDPAPGPACLDLLNWSSASPCDAATLAPPPEAPEAAAVAAPLLAPRLEPRGAGATLLVDRPANLLSSGRAAVGARGCIMGRTPALLPPPGTLGLAAPASATTLDLAAAPRSVLLGGEGARAAGERGPGVDGEGGLAGAPGAVLLAAGLPALAVVLTRLTEKLRPKPRPCLCS